MKDEALKLALVALELNNSEWKSLADSGDCGFWRAEDQDHYKQTKEAITAIKQALAAPVQPVAPLKEVDVLMMAETHGIDPNTKGLYGFYIDCISNQPVAQPAVQEPVEVDQATMELAESVGLIGPTSRTHDLHAAIQRFHDLICVNATIKAAKMAADAIRESTPPAQPAVPDAIHHTDLSEHPQYIEGWNDCRAEMLKGMKP
jgi:hypothetical protein